MASGKKGTALTVFLVLFILMILGVVGFIVIKLVLDNQEEEPTSPQMIVSDRGSITSQKNREDGDELLVLPGNTNKTYSSSEYEVKYKDGWQMQQGDLLGSAGVVFTSGDGNGVINILTETMDRNYSLEEYKTAALDIVKVLYGIEDINEEKITVNDLDAYRVKYVVAPEVGIIQTIIVRGNKAFILTYTGNAAHMEAFFEMEQTFILK